ncbi:hypothetical protein SNEBB_008241 [Seison nebaliae]|nr:hypothetical protein SNEBB_008241 [Seison nebaliae]
MFTNFIPGSLKQMSDRVLDSLKDEDDDADTIEVDELKEKLRLANEEIANLNKEKQNTLSHNYYEKEEQIEKMGSEIERLRKHLLQQTSENDEELLKNHTEIRDLKKKMGTREKRITMLLELNKKLKRRIDSVDNSPTSSNTTLDLNESNSKVVDVLNEEIFRLQQLLKKKEEVERTDNELNAEIYELKEENESLLSSIKHSDSIKIENENLQNKLNESLKSNDELMEKQQKLKDDLNHIIEKLTTQHLHLTEQYEELDNKYKNRMEHFDKENKSLNDSLANEREKYVKLLEKNEGLSENLMSSSQFHQEKIQVLENRIKHLKESSNVNAEETETSNQNKLLKDELLENENKFNEKLKEMELNRIVLEDKYQIQQVQIEEEFEKEKLILIDTCESLTSDVQAQQERITELDDDNDKLKNLLDQYTTEEDNCKRELNKFKMEKSEISIELENLKKENSEFSTKIEEFNMENCEISSHLEKMEKEKSEMLTELEFVRNEKCEIVSNLKKMETENIEMLGSLEEVKKEKSELHSEMEKMKIENIEISSELDEIKNLSATDSRRSDDEFHQNIEKIQFELEKISHEKEEMKKCYESKLLEKKNKIEEVQEKTIETLNEMNEKIEQLLKTNANLTEQNESQEQENERIRNENQSLEMKVGEFKKLVEDVDERLTKEEARYKEIIVNEQSRNKQLLEKIEKNGEILSEKFNEIHKMKNKIDELNTQLEIRGEEIQIAVDEKEKYLQQLISRKEKCFELSQNYEDERKLNLDLMTQHEEIEKEIKNYSNRLSKLEPELENFLNNEFIDQEEISRKQKEINKIEKLLQSTENERDQWKDRFERLKQHLIEKESELDITGLKQAEREDELRKRCQNYEIELVSLKQRMDEIKKEALMKEERSTAILHLAEKKKIHDKVEKERWNKLMNENENRINELEETIRILSGKSAVLNENLDRKIYVERELNKTIENKRMEINELKRQKEESEKKWLEISSDLSSVNVYKKEIDELKLLNRQYELRESELIPCALVRTMISKFLTSKTLEEERITLEVVSDAAEFSDHEFRELWQKRLQNKQSFSSKVMESISNTAIDNKQRSRRPSIPDQKKMEIIENAKIESLDTPLNETSTTSCVKLSSENPATKLIFGKASGIKQFLKGSTGNKYHSAVIDI